LAALYPAAGAFPSARRGVGFPDVRAKVDRVVQTQGAQDGLARGALEISMAGRQASRWLWALALQADLHARREAKDSNSVWAAQASKKVDA
jgi:hypothetical protein